MTDVSVYLSPHLDDAVLSCAGRILAEVHSGRRVIVATLFSHGDDKDDTETAAQYRMRREEDRRAIALLGAEPRWLGLLDAPYRRSFYDGFRAIVLETHPDDEAFVRDVERVIERSSDELRPGVLYAPLGIGTHIDHRLTHDAVENLRRRGSLRSPVVFYEDRPYAFVRHSVRMRLREIGAEVELSLAATPSARIAAEFSASFDRAGYVNAYLPPGPERERCRAILLERLSAGSKTDGPRLAPQITEVDDSDDRERIACSVAAYASQIGDLFGDLDGFTDAAAAYSCELGGEGVYAERCWRV